MVKSFGEADEDEEEVDWMDLDRMPRRGKEETDGEGKEVGKEEGEREVGKEEGEREVGKEEGEREVGFELGS